MRHSTGPRGGGDWYDALPLPDGALGLAVGSVTGSGPSAVAAMGRLRASLRAYAVMEGEDPVAVLSDLELLLRLTEPARSATALFAFTEPPPGTVMPGGIADPFPRKLVLAGAGHCPPLILGALRTEFVETSLSAPLGMLACWEAPSVEIEPAGGETLLLYSDGLLHRTGEPMDRAFTRLHAAAAGVPRPAAMIRRRSLTTSCARCCRRAWTIRRRRRTWCCSRRTSRGRAGRNGLRSGPAGAGLSAPCVVRRAHGRPPGRAPGPGTVRPVRADGRHASYGRNAGEVTSFCPWTAFDPHIRWKAVQS